MSYNIRFGGAGREKLIGAVVKACAPDLVVFQEATDTRVIEKVADHAELPHRASRRGHSLAFASRVEISHHEWKHPRELERAFLEIEPAGTNAKIFGVHLRAVHSNWTERRRVIELRSLLHCINEDRDTFHIVTGDFNTLAPGEKLEMHRLPRRLRLLALVLGGRIRFRTIQIMLDEGYTDAYRHVHHDAGDERYTFPVWDPHVRLDYAFVPRNAADCVKTCDVAHDAPDAAKASDHFPLVADIELP
jgi:exodeoxyribonuclease III